MKFTVQALDALKARPREYLVFDTRGARNAGRLALRIRPTPEGTPRKDFLFVYRAAGRRRRLTLGRYGNARRGELSLKEAFDRFAELSAMVRSGVDPLAERAHAKAKAVAEAREAKQRGTVGDLIRGYVDHLRRQGARSADEVERSLLGPKPRAMSNNPKAVAARKSRRRKSAANSAPFKSPVSMIGAERLARDVTPDDIRMIVRACVARGSREQANRVRQYFQTAFRFGIEHDQRVDLTAGPNVQFGIQHNPARDVPKVQRPDATGVRDIELSADLIRQLWTDMGGRDDGESCIPPMRPAHADALRLILATGGQRVEVVLGARWDEIDEEQKLWTVPLSRRKSRRFSRGPHVVPLNQTAVQIIARQRGRSGDSEFLFPVEVRSARAEHLHVDRLWSVLRAWIEAAKFPLTFAPRDLRQTWHARAGELGLSKEIRDRIQDRPPNDIGAKHYDSYDYLDEKRRALDAWDQRLRSIREGATVVPIRRAS